MAIILDSIRSALRTKVAGVTGISGVAPVYDYLRLVTNEEQIKAIFIAGQNRPHFWSVTPSRENPFEIVQRMGCQDGIYRWEIHGFYAIDDSAASEKAFLVIVQAVLEALRTDLKLGAANLRPYELPAWKEHDHRMASSLGLHHVLLTVGVKKEL
jgi:hypothetical protein